MRIGEVIETATFYFGAQVAELHHPPPLGSLVKTREGEVEIYGVVCAATTIPLEPGRPAVALGQGEEGEAEVFQRHPQLPHLLRTQFEAVVVGHRDGGEVRPYLPPRPPRLHSAILPCSPQEEQELCQRLNFLPLLLSIPQGREEVVAACLRHLSRCQPDPLSFLVAAGKELAQLLPGEAVTLQTILRRLRG